MKTLTTHVLILMFLVMGPLMAQNRQITGKVTSENGSELPGVTIQVKGTAVGTFTKSDGTYKLSVPATAKTLIFKLLGMKTKEIQMGADDVYNATLEEDKIAMEEVVVTAIGLEREKKSLGYSIEELGGQTIENSRSVNVVNSLNGKIAGVQVTSSSGTPGGSSYIKIRGNTSITGSNQPLFVVDGVPIDNSQSYSGNPDDGNNNLLSGVAYSNRAIDLNPDDIESMTVLKGPAATALYGLMASNGAIIITTKKGTGAVGGQPINVSFSTSLSIDVVNKLPGMQGKYAQGQWVDANGLRYGFDGFDQSTAVPTYRGPGTGEALSWGPDIATLKFNGDATYKWDKNGNLIVSDDPNLKDAVAYDNSGYFYQPGSTWNNSINLAGGTEMANFFMSLSNSNTKGVVPKSTFNRTTVRFNGEARIAEWLKASASMNYINSGGTRIQQGSNTSGVMLGLMRTTPTFDNSNGFGDAGDDNEAAYMFPDGKQRNYRGGGGYDNPFWTVNKNPFTDNVNRFIGNVQFNIYFTENIDLMWRLGGDLYTDVRKQEFAINSRNVPSGRMFNHEIGSSDIISDVILTFNYKLSSDLFLKFLLGNNVYSSTGSSLYVQGDGLVIPDFYHISNTTGQIIRETKDRLHRMAFYGDLTLDYLGWLYFNGTLRNEQSTTLPEANNSFWYGQGSLSFIFTEAFKDAFKDSPLSYGQLRASYAVVGKDDPLYGTTTTYIQASYADGWTDGISFPYGGSVGYTEGDVLGNDQLMPESTTSLEFGFNINFFNNLFGIDFTYYSSESTDQIFNVPIASSSGYWRQIKNAGRLTNTGMEIVLNATPVSNEDFTWSLNLNFATNDNMVEELAPGVDNIFLGGFEGSSIRGVAGKPYATIFGYGWKRDESGNVMINDDPTSAEYGFPILDDLEMDFGNANPDFIIGFTNTFTWNGFTLSFLFDWKSGGVMWNGTRGAMYYFGTHEDISTLRDTKKTFAGVKASSGAANDIEVTLDQNWLCYGNGNGFYGNNTEDFIEETSWVRLRELSLGYQFPRVIAESLYLSDLMITFTGRNLWLSTDYKGVDPETNLMGANNAQGLDYFNMPGVTSYVFTLGIKL